MARRKIGFWKRVAVGVVKPTMIVMSKRDWRGMEHIPRSGPVLVVANHISHVDPLALAHFVYDSGRWPVFLAKSGLFHAPVLGWLMHRFDQTPVERGTVDAIRALQAAVDSLNDGKCVVIYPEGTTTREPDLWPMRGKTGAARLWLSTGAPVVPVVTWGPQNLFDPRTHKVHAKPQTPVTVLAGPPLDLSKWAGSSPTAPVLAEITEHIMLALRDLVAQVRGGTAPPLWQASQSRAVAASTVDNETDGAPNADTDAKPGPDADPGAEG